MGQKVHPFGIRLGYNKNWLSRWFSAKEYPAFVFEDSKIRKFVKQRNAEAGLAKIEIERAGGKVRLILSTARPGIIIGRKGVEIEKLRTDLRKESGGDGIKVSCAGRLAGAEIARREWYRDGRVPLQTLRADIDYGFAEARTTYGTIGVKVWIYKGEILDKEVEQNVSAQKS